MKEKHIVINKCYGGFSLSHKAVMRYAELMGLTLYPWLDDITKKVYGKEATIDNPRVNIHYTLVPQEEYQTIEAEERKKPVGPSRFAKTNEVYFSDRDIARDDPILIKVVREMGKEANGRFAKLKIIGIPADIQWTIEEYDGLESIAEAHRIWY